MSPRSIWKRCFTRFVSRYCSKTQSVLNIRLTGSMAVLMNVVHYTLWCANGTKFYNITGCQFGVIPFSCECAVQTHKVTLSANLKDCDQSLKTRMHYLIDLKTLMHFFNESDFPMLAGDSLLDQPVNVSLPKFKLQEDTFLSTADREITRNLKLAANSILLKEELFFKTSWNLNSACFNSKLVSIRLYQLARWCYSHLLSSHSWRVKKGWKRNTFL